MDIVLCCWERQSSRKMLHSDGVGHGRPKKAPLWPVWVQNVSGCCNFTDEVLWLSGVWKVARFVLETPAIVIYSDSITANHIAFDQRWTNK